MNNLVDIEYAQTGKATNTDALGMREMQALVYAQCDRQHLLVKAPPASGKSRAMMFVALAQLVPRLQLLKTFTRLDLRLLRLKVVSLTRRTSQHIFAPMSK